MGAALVGLVAGDGDLYVRSGSLLAHVAGRCNPSRGVVDMDAGYSGVTEPQYLRDRLISSLPWKRDLCDAKERVDCNAHSTAWPDDLKSPKRNDRYPAPSELYTGAAWNQDSASVEQRQATPSIVRW